MRILICDDDQNITQLLQKYMIEFFKQAKLKIPEIQSYNSGEELLSDSGAKDIVFLDVEMPGLNGIYVGRKLKEKNRTITVYTLSRDFIVLHNMAYWAAKLNMPCFFQTHRSFIVNMKYVTNFDHSLIHLYNNKYTAYLTKRKYSKFKEAYFLYLESTR